MVGIYKIDEVLRKYGEDVFEIENNYTRCNIPFEREVIVYIDNKMSVLVSY